MKKFIVFFVLSVIAFVACENDNGATSPSMKVTSATTLEFGAEGGSEEIIFELQNANNSKVNVSENATWISTTLGESKVIVTVDANTTTEAREATITLQYYKSSAKISVKQEAGMATEYDVVFKAKRFEGIYFGTEYSSAPNYFIILSDIGAASDGTPKANGTYYFFDFYSKVAANEEEAITLPNGTYTFDTTDSFAAGTFSDSGSFHAVMDSAGKYETSASYKSATVTVTDNKFEASIELVNGEKHLVTFDGNLFVAVGYIYSTFTEDVEFNVEGATISVSYFGTENEMNKHNWFIEATKDNDLFTVEVLNNSATDFYGIYTPLTSGASLGDGGQFIQGMLGSENLIGTWYALLTNGTIKGDKMAPMIEGMIQIQNNGNGNASINYSCKDDAGNNITGSVSGTIVVNQ